MKAEQDKARQTWCHGQLVETLSVFDRAFQYGDGFFTTLLVVEQALLNWSGHWRRLSLSAARLQFPVLKEATILQHIKQAVVQFETQQTSTTNVVKVLVSRGEAGRGYAIPDDSMPLVLIQVSAAPIRVGLCLEDSLQTNSKKIQLNFPPPMALQLECCQTQASIQPQLAGLKHLNRLDSVLSQTEVQQKQHQEGVMLNAMGYVISGTQSNVFMIKGQDLITPKLQLSGVEGTTRYQLSQMTRLLGLNWQEADITLAQLLQADELFLSNAVRGVMPVKQLENKTFSSVQTLKIHQAWNVWQAENVQFLKDIK